MQVYRIFLNHRFKENAKLAIDQRLGHYLANVVRKKHLDKVHVFNGMDGEWEAKLISPCSKIPTHLKLLTNIKEQPEPLQIINLLAIIKHKRMEYAIQKLVEIGTRDIFSMLTHHCQERTLNIERLTSIATEAAEQCEAMHVPRIFAPQLLNDVLQNLEDNTDSILLFFDEKAPPSSPLTALIDIFSQTYPKQIYVLTGPEGGFTDDERCILESLKSSYRLSLGKRIYRAETAPIVANALIFSVLDHLKR